MSPWARAIPGAISHSNARQRNRMELKRSMKIGGNGRGRKSAKNITQGSNEKDGASHHDRSAERDRAFQRGRRFVDRLNAWAERPGDRGDVRRPEGARARRGGADNRVSEGSQGCK